MDKLNNNNNNNNTDDEHHGDNDVVTISMNNKAQALLIQRSVNNFSEIRKKESTKLGYPNFKSSGMQVFTWYTLGDKVQELKFWSSGIEQNSPHEL